MAVIIQEVCGTEQNGLFFPDLFGRGAFDQLLPHRRRSSRRRRVQRRHGTGQAGRGRRAHAALLAPLSAEGAPDLDARTGAARHAERSAGPEPAARRVPHVDRRRGEPAAARHRPDRRAAQFALRLLGVGPRERAHLGQPLRPGPQSHNVQQHTEIQHLPAGGDRHRHPAHGRRGDALPRGGRIRRQYGRGAGGAADFQPAANPPDHRQSGQPADRLERGGHLRCAGLRRERPRHRHDERHLGRHLHQKRHVQFAFDREDRRRTAGAEPPHARRKNAPTSSSVPAAGVRRTRSSACPSSGTTSPKPR